MKQVYLILAALMLLCLAPMPYGYFQLVRFVAMVAFGVMAYRYYHLFHKACECLAVSRESSTFAGKSFSEL